MHLYNWKLWQRVKVNLGPVSWRPTTVKWRQSSQSNRHCTICTRQTEYHEALPSSANVQSHLTSSFADDGNASWYWVCRVPMVEWRLDWEDCRHLTVVGLHDTGPWCLRSPRVGLWQTKLVQHTEFVCWLAGCLTSQLQASVSQGRICSDNFTCCPHWDTSCRSNVLPHPVTVYWHRADQSQRWPYNARRLAG